MTMQSILRHTDLSLVKESGWMVFCRFYWGVGWLFIWGRIDDEILALQTYLYSMS